MAVPYAVLEAADNQPPPLCSPDLLYALPHLDVGQCLIQLIITQAEVAG